MKRWATVVLIFIIVVGTIILIEASLNKPRILSDLKSVEISKGSAPTTQITTPPTEEIALVKRVIDGDTIELSDNRRIRYIGIDSPEVVDPQKPIECYGKEAKGENQRLTEGKTVRLTKDVSEVDKYGRFLRYVYIEDIFVNDYLVRHGFAHASTFPPDIKYAEKFRLAQEEARENNRGLWSGCTQSNPTPLRQGFAGQANITLTPIMAGAQSGCVIKGNISSTGDRIYHLPGCGSYDKTVIDVSAGERWFCTEEEAVAAGWRKAKNC